MKYLFAVALVFLSACNQIGLGDGTQSLQNNSAGTPGIQSPRIAGANVLAVTVGNCGPNSYFNEPCVSVTICSPGTSQCQTIPNVLLDTGSYGLRLFASVITVPLTAITDSRGNQLAECAQFGSGAEWGAVKTADVILGGESAVRIPIHVVDAGFQSPPEDCTDLDVSPQAAGFNGILGVGLFSEDCGPGCVNTPDNGVYFACSGGGCASTAVALNQQVVNPVSRLALDNNGVIVQLPSVASGGVISVTGNLILGIGTQSNNTPGNVRLFQANDSGNFTTQFDNQTFASSFIDSGSNALYFPSALSTCSSETFYCPESTVSLSAQQLGSVVPFQISNADADLNSGNAVFSDIGGDIGGVLSTDFDWGLPFFFGKSVYVGIAGQSSSLGSGPYWAY